MRSMKAGHRIASVFLAASVHKGATLLK